MLTPSRSPLSNSKMLSSACPASASGTSLIEAIENEQLLLHFQPKLKLSTNKIVGAEALLRWDHPERGLLAPGAFLPELIQAQNDLRLFEWVANAAIWEQQKWLNDGFQLSVSVNISSPQFLDPSFLHQLHSWFSRLPDVSRNYFELELVESTLITNIKVVSRLILLCEQWGIKIALDDFGTGHSSLVHLRELPASIVKIDQSFVSGMFQNSTDREIVSNIIRLIKALGKEVVAEGVEDPCHCELLGELGCDYAQGYGIAAPLPADQFIAMAKDERGTMLAD